ncbi:unnamed protein product, partial [Brenthis ino]
MDSTVKGMDTLLRRLKQAKSSQYFTQSLESLSCCFAFPTSVTSWLRHLGFCTGVYVATCAQDLLNQGIVLKGGQRGQEAREVQLAAENRLNDLNQILTAGLYRDSGYNTTRPRRGRPLPVPVSAPRTRSQPPTSSRSFGPREFERDDNSPVRYEKYGRDVYDEDEEEFPKISLPLQDLQAALKDLDNYQTKYTSKPEMRSKSLPRPSRPVSDYGPRRDFDDQRHFDFDESKEIYEMHDLHDVDYENYKERKALEERERRLREREDYIPRDRGYDPEDDDFEFDIPRSRRAGFDRRYNRGRSEYYERDIEECLDRRRGRRARSAACGYEKRAGGAGEVAERGYVERPRRLRRLYTVEDAARGPHRYTPSPDRDDWSDEAPPLRRGRPAAWGSRQSDIYAVQLMGPVKEEIKPVPIWLCVFLVASYIVVGTFLFKQWEGWAYLDAAYFCFITLTTIGFGDFVPAQGQSGEGADAVHSIALCSLYLLFGIALLAMSFNLVQEEVRANVAAIATRLGIIKPRDHTEDY